MRHDYSIASEELLLSPLAEEDIEYLRQLRNREENRRCFLHDALIEKERQQSWYRNYLDKEGDYMFSVRERETGHICGAVAIYALSQDKREAEFGRLLIDPERAGRGWGYEATRLACRLAFEQLKTESLSLEVFADNERALKIYERAGFVAKREREFQGRVLILMQRKRPAGRVLMTASRLSHIANFHLPYIDALKASGFDVDVLGEGEQKGIGSSDRIHRLPFDKSLISIRNLKTVVRIRRILERENYDLIISNSTLAGFLTRTAKRYAAGKKAGLLHISHGYLFSEKTFPLKKTIYIAAERLCRGQTDLLLVMNREDLSLARKYDLAEKIGFIRGMGIELPDFSDLPSREELRRSCGFSESEIVAIYPAEFSKRKNQLYLIQSLEAVLKEIPSVRLLLAGEGDLLGVCREKIKALGLEESILCPGHLQGIREWIFAADFALSAAKSEGLPFNIMEAMSLGVPVLASSVKGHQDLIEDGKDGRLFDLEDPKELIRKFRSMVFETEENALFARRAKEKIKRYNRRSVVEENMQWIRSLLPEAGKSPGKVKE